MGSQHWTVAGGRDLHIQPYRPSPLSGRRRQEREGGGERVARERKREQREGRSAGTPARPCPQALPRAAHLLASMMSWMRAARPPAPSMHVVDLVAADLAVRCWRQGRAPQHANGLGVERSSPPPRRRWALARRRGGGAGGGRYWGAQPRPGQPLPDARVTVTAVNRAP